MTQATVQDILQRALDDDTFRQALLTTPVDALAGYKSALSEAEYAALQTVDASILSGMRNVIAGRVARKWYQPGSFKEMAAAALSLVLLLLMLATALRAFMAIGTAPIVVQVGDSQVLTESPFDQTKDLLSIFFPLFSAVVTFYLGVAIEGKRADRNADEADRANADRQAATEQKDAAVEEAVSAEKSALEAKKNANAALDDVERLTLEKMGAQRGGLEGGVAQAPLPAEAREAVAQHEAANRQLAQQILARVRAARATIE